MAVVARTIAVPTDDDVDTVDARVHSLRLERLSGPEAMEAIAAEWDALDAQLSPRTPFSTPLWNQLWWRHLSRRSGAIRDRFFVHVLRDGCGRLVAVAPLMLTHRPGWGPLRLGELQFFGADRNLTEIRGAICLTQHQEQVLRVLTGGLAATSATADAWAWMRWGRIAGDDSPTVQRLAETRAIAASRDVKDYVLDLPATWSAFRAGLPRNIKESLRKCYNSLKRGGHGFHLRVVDRVEDAAAALDRFFVLHKARAAASFGVAHPDVFAAPNARAFLREYARQMAERDQLRLFELEISGVVCASRLGFQFGDELYLYYSGFDPAWAHYSVMTTTVAEAIRWAIDHRLKIVNLSTGTDVSKLRWRPREICYREIVQVAPTWRGRRAFALFSAAQRLVKSRGRTAEMR